MPDQTTLNQLASLVAGSLPAEYLQLLRTYPAELQGRVRDEHQDPDWGTVCQVDLPSDLEIIVDLNREVRSCSVLDPEGAEFHWPESLLVIGETGAGDYYCLDTTGEVPGVLQFEHQPVEFYEVADSLSDFVSLLLESFVQERQPGRQDG
jgi:hypothetical protein